MAAAHVFVDDLSSPVLDDDDRRHLTKVLRLRDGEVVTASDGRGGRRSCVFAAADGSLVVDADVDSGTEHVDAPSPPVTVAMAMPKGDRLEWAVQKVTELGVDRVVLLHAARSVVRWDDDVVASDRTTRRLDRLRRVAREAAMQSRRVWLPVLEGPVAFADAVAWPGACVADADGAGAPSLSRPTVLVGPEGGWTDDERAAASAAGAPFVAFGPHVLRVETAAVAGAVLLTALRAGQTSVRAE